MAVELVVPNVGESITEVQIADWLKSEGERVDKDANVAVIETEKATVELPSPVSGILTRVTKRRGDMAKVGEVIAYVEEKEGAGPADGRTQAPTAEPAPEKPGGTQTLGAPAVRDGGGGAAQAGTKPDESRVMPAARRVLEEHGLKPEEVTPTGKGGRLLKEDVLRHLAGEGSPGAAEKAAIRSVEEAAPAADFAPEPRPVAPEPPPSMPERGDEEVVPMTMLRRRVAERLVHAQQTAALLTTFNEIDMGAVTGLRKRYQDAFTKRYDVKLGFMSFFVKAVVEALKQVPQLNAEIRGSNVVYRNYYDIGVAIGGGRGLVVPVLRHAELMSFAQIESAIGDFGQRAQRNALKLEELQGGTFTISNGGVYGSLLSTPIVNPPQSGILGMHAIQDRPVAREGQVVVRPMMYVALTYDHRIVDGREAVTFLRRIKEVIEDPARIFLEV